MCTVPRPRCALATEASSCQLVPCPTPPSPFPPSGQQPMTNARGGTGGHPCLRAGPAVPEPHTRVPVGQAEEAGLQRHMSFPYTPDLSCLAHCLCPGRTHRERLQCAGPRPRLCFQGPSPKTPVEKTYRGVRQVP